MFYTLQRNYVFDRVFESSPLQVAAFDRINESTSKNKMFHYVLKIALEVSGVLLAYK
jgi:hypothetical protein